MKKLILSILTVMLILCIRINAAEDFCIRLDMNAYDEGAFSADGWKSTGDVNIINSELENLLDIGNNSNTIYTFEDAIKNNSVVLDTTVAIEKSGGFFGIYMTNESGKTCFSFAFRQNNEIAAYTTGGFKALCGYNTGVFYDVKCVINSENSTFSVLINDVEYISGVPMRNKSGIREIKLYTEKTSAYIKGFSIYSGKLSGIKINSTPVDGSETIAQGRDEFEINFCDDMNPDTLNSTTIVLRDKSGADIPYVGEYVAQKRSFVLRPAVLYNEKNGLYVIVRSGEDGARTTDGGKIKGSSYILDFDVVGKGVAISDISVKEESGIMKLSFSAENLCDIIKKQRVIIAGYDSGRLISVTTCGIEEKPLETAEFEIEYNKRSNGLELYAYIFDLEDMIPVSERILLKSQEMSE